MEVQAKKSIREQIPFLIADIVCFIGLLIKYHGKI